MNKINHFANQPLLNKIKQLFTKSSSGPEIQSCIYNMRDPYWSGSDYNNFAGEAYNKNVIAYRCINLISQGAASVAWTLYENNSGIMHELKEHPLLKLLQRPNPLYARAEFFENIYAYRMISGNAFVLAITSRHTPPKELHLLRPDRVEVIGSKNGMVAGYSYNINDEKVFYPVNNLSGRSNVLHLRNFHPLDDWYGLSPVEAASYSIDQHNQAAIWNQSLLQNGARPCGAIVVKNSSDGYGNSLTEEQFNRLKAQLNQNYSGARNSGKPILLEGGLEWQEMSLTPKDMDFIEAKNSAARDIALCFGVPPQLLGIPGDNTYSNMQEARLALWEETILPMLDHMTDALNNWLAPMFGSNLKLSYNKENISVLAQRRDSVWSRVEDINFLTINEKRAMVGYSPLPEGDSLVKTEN